MRKRKDRQSGFSLILVLIVVAASVILGLGYLTSASIKLVCSDNMVKSGRAKYLAESGLQHAFYTLQSDSESLSDSSESSPIGPFFSDGTNDSYVFYAVPDTDIQGQYLLVAKATVGGITQTSSVTVYYAGASQISNEHAIIIGGGQAWLPVGLTLNGDVHINGNLINFSGIDGNASAEGIIWDPYGRISGDTTPGTDEYEFPEVEWDDYLNYAINNQSNAAVSTTLKDLKSDNKIVKKGAITTSNVGGVVQLVPKEAKKGYVKIKKNVEFNGTLVIDGDLILDGKNIEITPVEGFPAIVTSGRIYITKNAKNVVLDGLVAASGGILPYGSKVYKSSTTINGGLVSDTRGYDFSLPGSHTLNYDADKCTIYDFSSGAELPEIEIIEWND